jgi:hypothetical protein
MRVNSRKATGRRSKRCAISLALVLCLGILCIPAAFAQEAQEFLNPKAASGVTVNFVTAPPTPLNLGFNGFNGNMNNAAEYYDANFQRVLVTLSPGWLRFPGGTDSEAFNWQTGEILPAWVDALAAKQYQHDINAARKSLSASTPTPTRRNPPKPLPGMRSPTMSQWRCGNWPMNPTPG